MLLFLGLTFADIVPDAKTIWAFSEQLKNFEREQALFDRFGEELDRQGFKAKSGLIVDGTFKCRVQNAECRVQSKNTLYFDLCTLHSFGP